MSPRDKQPLFPGTHPRPVSLTPEWDAYCTGMVTHSANALTARFVPDVYVETLGQISLKPGMPRQLTPVLGSGHTVMNAQSRLMHDGKSAGIVFDLAGGRDSVPTRLIGGNMASDRLPFADASQLNYAVQRRINGKWQTTYGKDAKTPTLISGSSVMEMLYTTLPLQNRSHEKLLHDIVMKEEEFTAYGVVSSLQQVLSAARPRSVTSRKSFMAQDHSFSTRGLNVELMSEPFCEEAAALAELSGQTGYVPASLNLDGRAARLDIFSKMASGHPVSMRATQFVPYYAGDKPIVQITTYDKQFNAPGLTGHLAMREAGTENGSVRYAHFDQRPDAASAAKNIQIAMQDILRSRGMHS